MSGIKDLRDFLAVLKDNKLLFETERAVDWKYEIGSLLAHPGGRGPENRFISQYQDKILCVRKCAGIHGRHCLALGCRKDEMTDFLADCLEHPVKPPAVADAPCHEKYTDGG